jgi:hypothetical protein
MNIKTLALCAALLSTPVFAVPINDAPVYKITGYEIESHKYWGWGGWGYGRKRKTTMTAIYSLIPVPEPQTYGMILAGIFTVFLKVKNERKQK